MGGIDFHSVRAQALEAAIRTSGGITDSATILAAAKIYEDYLAPLFTANVCGVGMAQNGSQPFGTAVEQPDPDEILGAYK